MWRHFVKTNFKMQRFLLLTIQNNRVKISNNIDITYKHPQSKQMRTQKQQQIMN